MQVVRVSAHIGGVPVSAEAYISEPESDGWYYCTKCSDRFRTQEDVVIHMNPHPRDFLYTAKRSIGDNRESGRSATLPRDLKLSDVYIQRRTRVYVAGPYTKGDPVQNVRRAILVGNELLQRGYAPFIPHLTMFWHLLAPNDYEAWLSYDFEWVDVCDVLLRLSGESSGADREVERAQRNNQPVYTDVDLLVASEPATREA